VIFTATDGYRLSIKKTALKIADELNILVPARALGEVIKVCGEEKSIKEVFMSKPEDAQLSFVIGDTEIRTRLIDGEYPNLEKIIPTKHNTRLVVEKEPLLKAVKSASVFARDSANIIRLHIEGQSITVAANTPQVGEDEIDIEAKVEGEGGDMAFNSRFLLEFLSNFQGEELVFEMTGSLNPGVFKPTKGDNYLHIIMPVRVQA
jgi:DNA polymerase-3 subunit beta